MIKKIIVIFVLILFVPITSIATNEIIYEQMKSLNMSSLIKEGENYTKEVFPDIDLNTLLTNAISGKLDNSSFLRSVLSLFGDEVLKSISLLR